MPYEDVDILVGGIDDPHLPVDQFDAVLIHNAYHEMAEHEAMLRHIRAALKRGGRFVIVEPMHDSSRGLTREQQVAQHTGCPAGSGCSWPAARDELVY